MTKNGSFGQVLNIWNLQPNSVTRRVNFIVENVYVEQCKYDILSNFQTMSFRMKATAADSGWEFCGFSRCLWWRGPLPNRCLPKSFSENLPTRQPRWAITSLCLVGWRISVGCFSGLVMVLAWEWKETWLALTDTICQASMRKVRDHKKVAAVSKIESTFQASIWQPGLKPLFHFPSHCSTFWGDSFIQITTSGQQITTSHSNLLMNGGKLYERKWNNLSFLP